MADAAPAIIIATFAILPPRRRTAACVFAFADRSQPARPLPLSEMFSPAMPASLAVAGSAQCHAATPVRTTSTAGVAATVGISGCLYQYILRRSRQHR
jgi:hypothetical protein